MWDAGIGSRTVRLTCLAVAVATVALGVTAGSASAFKQSVSGQGHLTSGHLVVNAVSDAGGGNPQGKVHFETQFAPGWEFEGPVLCLRVDGNRAVVGTELPTLGTSYFHITDGHVIGNIPLPDRVEGQFLQTSPPDQCPAPSGQGEQNDHGNFVVHDAPTFGRAR